MNDTIILYVMYNKYSDAVGYIRIVLIQLPKR